MNILITGAKGMVGTALVNNLKNIRDGKTARAEYPHRQHLLLRPRQHPGAAGRLVHGLRLRVQPRGCEPPAEQRGVHAGQLRLCLHAAGHAEEAWQSVAIMLSSSIRDAHRAVWPERLRQEQAGGRGAVLPLWARERREGSGLPLPKPHGAQPPEVQSAVSTFCWAVANDEPFTVNDRSTELELLYIDDLTRACSIYWRTRKRTASTTASIPSPQKTDATAMCPPLTR